MAHGHSLPNPSQSALILSWLQSGKPLTAKEALDRFGCFRLAARINDLTNAGHVIHAKQIRVRNRDGKLCRIAEYSMSRPEGGEE